MTCFVIVLSRKVSRKNKKSFNTENIDPFKTKLGASEDRNFLQGTPLSKHPPEPTVCSLHPQDWTPNYFSALACCKYLGYSRRNFQIT